MGGRLSEDLRRKREHYTLKPSFKNKYLKVTLQFGTLAVMVYRLGRFCIESRWGWLLWPVYGLADLVAGWIGRISIDPRTDIGPGFVIHNFSTIFIEAERIGKNFTINQGVTVGYDWRRSGRPILGDNVFLGAGAKVLGAVRVGNNVVVAANALVVAPVESNCVVSGVPARVVMRLPEESYVESVPVHGPAGS